MGRRRAAPAVTENVRFTEYYLAQQICDSREELDELLQALRTPLPAAFRVNYGIDLMQLTESYYENDAADQHKPRRLEWLRSGFVWANLSRNEIRNDQNLAALKARLVGDSQRGAVVRQEVVSMVPPEFLHPGQSSTVLDACAAPGSKTSQLCDHVLSDCATPGFDVLGIRLPVDACILANDVNIDRARMLAHQLAKSSYPYSAIVCGDGAAFPKSNDVSQLYSHVLCDVPCSGDGTLRKNPDIWTSWNAQNGLIFHNRQLQILSRCLQLMKPGGRLVYSTCSHNPLEDEAVVGAALTEFGDRFELVDMHSPGTNLEGLVARKGLTTWKVPDPAAFKGFKSTDEQSNLWISGWEEYNARSDKNKHVAQTMFPDHFTSAIRAQLPKTSRFLAHVNNTGSFFVAVFRCKVDAEPALKKSRKEQRQQGHTTDDTVDIEPINLESDADFQEILKYYGMVRSEEDEFANGVSLIPGTSNREGAKRFQWQGREIRDFVEDFSKYDYSPVFRKKEQEKRFYLTTPKCHEFFQSNPSLNFISMGIPFFARVAGERLQLACSYRLMGSSAIWAMPYLRRRLVYCTYSMAMAVLEDTVVTGRLLDAERKGLVKNLDSCRKKNEHGELLLEPGSVLFVAGDVFEHTYRSDPDAEVGTLPAGSSTPRFGSIVIPALLTGPGNVAPMVRKESRATQLAYLLAIMDILGPIQEDVPTAVEQIEPQQAEPSAPQ